jgi:internalin A
MKTLISILIVLLVSAGCGKKEQHSNPNDKNGTATSVEATDKSPKATKVIANSPEAKAVIDKAIRKAANKPSGELTAADLEKVTQLELREAGITDLSPLKGLSNLKGLSLGENQITDIKPIEGLTQLEDLWLDSNKIQDLTPLAGMTKLQRLMLHINQISDLKPLSGLTEINYFALTDNLVEDLTPLKGMKKLQQLFLLRNPSLTTVHIEKLQAKLPGCSITHNAKSNIDVEKETSPKASPNKLIVDPIVENEVRMSLKKPTGELTKENLEKMSSLDLAYNKLAELPDSLEKLTNLTLLGLDSNQLTDVKGLEKLTKLTMLFLPDNQLTDVKGLENLTKLTNLNLSNNPDLTKAQIDELQKALPKCKIEHDFQQ